MPVAKTRKTTPSARAAAPEPAATQPETLRECLTPLIHVATTVGAVTYAWGLKHGSIMRASVVLDLCETISKRCEELIAHEESVGKRAGAVAAK